jgi:hypothetical protein
MFFITAYTCMITEEVHVVTVKNIINGNSAEQVNCFQCLECGTLIYKVNTRGREDMWRSGLGGTSVLDADVRQSV